MATFNRSKTVDRQVPLYWYWVDRSPSGVVLYTSPLQLSNASKGLKTVVMDSISANYVARRKRGEVILNDCDRFMYLNTSTAPTLFAGTHPSWGSRTLYGDLAAAFKISAVMPGWFSTDIVNSGNSALLSAYGKMNESDFQALVSVAEFRKTVALLAGPFHAFYDLTVAYDKRLKAIRNLKRSVKESKLKFALRTHKLLGNAWLQYRYGWRPLVNDIQNAMKAYEAIMGSKKQPPLVVKRSTRELAYGYSGKNLDSKPSNGVWMEYKHRWDVKVTAGVIYRLRDQSLNARAAHITGLTLRDLPGVAWELVPYSFVVDWFIDVGSWLNAVLPNAGVEVMGNWVTTKTTLVSFNTVLTWCSTITDPPVTTYSPGGGDFVERTISTSRRVGLPLPALPQFTFRDLGTLRIVDGLELIVQRLKTLRG